jgi:hypothetical protein
MSGIFSAADHRPGVHYQTRAGLLPREHPRSQQTGYNYHSHPLLLCYAPGKAYLTVSSSQALFPRKLSRIAKLNYKLK